MNELATLTHDYLEYPVIMKAVWATMDSAGKDWKRIFKVWWEGNAPLCSG